MWTVCTCMKLRVSWFFFYRRAVITCITVLSDWDGAKQRTHVDGWWTRTQCTCTCIYTHVTRLLAGKARAQWNKYIAIHVQTVCARSSPIMWEGLQYKAVAEQHTYIHVYTLYMYLYISYRFKFHLHVSTCICVVLSCFAFLSVWVLCETPHFWTHSNILLHVQHVKVVWGYIQIVTHQLRVQLCPRIALLLAAGLRVLTPSVPKPLLALP